jgi:hypothetical protein
MLFNNNSTLICNLNDHYPNASFSTPATIVPGGNIVIAIDIDDKGLFIFINTSTLAVSPLFDDESNMGNIVTNLISEDVGNDNQVAFYFGTNNVVEALSTKSAIYRTIFTAYGIRMMERDWKMNLNDEMSRYINFTDENKENIICGTKLNTTDGIPSKMYVMDKNGNFMGGGFIENGGNYVNAISDNNWIYVGSEAKVYIYIEFDFSQYTEFLYFTSGILPHDIFTGKTDNGNLIFVQKTGQVWVGKYFNQHEVINLTGLVNHTFKTSGNFVHLSTTTGFYVMDENENVTSIMNSEAASVNSYPVIHNGSAYYSANNGSVYVVSEKEPVIEIGRNHKNSTIRQNDTVKTGHGKME